MYYDLVVWCNLGKTYTMISCALKGVNLFGNQLLVCSSNRSILRAMTTTGYNDPYKILGIEHDANETTIKSAYIRLVKKYHPDKNTGNPEANETFIRVQNAYRILMEKIPKEGWLCGFLWPGCCIYAPFSIKMCYIVRTHTSHFIVVDLFPGLARVRLLMAGCKVKLDERMLPVTSLQHFV